jgi:pSer/pThr/pTyr-binding forkhead associated (FHA) protein
VPGDGLRLEQFPFRIGRASEAHEGDPLDLNDLWLLDEEPFHVSRNHLAIDQAGTRRFVVRDRGSHLGIVLNDFPIGGTLPQREAELEDGDNVLIIGGRSSPYQFRLHLERFGV